jgi:nicotinamidase/pyrazinamidase
MTSIDRRLFVFGLCGVALTGAPLGRINSVLAATKISPDERSVLIVVDVQNCFLPGGSLAVKDGEQVVPIINLIAKSFPNVVMTQDWHTPEHVSFASAHPGKKPFETIKLPYGDQVLWPDHCVQGTSSADISKDISIPQAELIVRKGYHKDMDSYSAFFEADHKTPTGLAGYLKERAIDKAFVGSSPGLQPISASPGRQLMREAADLRPT